MEGIVFDIQRASIHDGPGIRTTVFLKGCDLRCKWCHNPESFSIRPQLSFNAAACSFCGRCKAVCPKAVHSFDNNNHAHNVDYAACIQCGACVAACNTSALKIIGDAMTAEKVMSIVLKDKAYYQSSGGGVTFSGGEPTFQLDFLAELLRLSKQHNLHTALETNGLADYNKLEPLLDNLDVVLLDYKHNSASEHTKYTGKSNAKLLQNLAQLSAAGKEIILRCPVIAGVNDTDEHLASIEQLLNKYKNISKVDILPYHNMGIAKWAQIGLASEVTQFESINNDIKNVWSNRLAR